MKKETLIRTTYHVTILAAGFLTLALELLVSRALVPHVGTSAYVWGALLVVSLVCMALGYGWGEYTSQRIIPDKKPAAFIRRALLASLFVVLASVFQYSINIILQVMPMQFAAMAGTFVILGPCLFFTASMTPLLISMEIFTHQHSLRSDPQESVETGNFGAGHSGLVLAEATAGAVLGALFTSFVILPNMAVDTGLALVALPLLLMALLTGYIHKRYIPPKIRKSAIFLIVGSLALMVLNQEIQARETIQIGQIKAQQKELVHTPYGTIRIIKTPPTQDRPSEYMWLMDGSTQNVMLETGQHRTSYTNAIVNILINYETKPQDILVLGGSAGLIARDLYVAGRNVDIVEIVPEAEELAREYFGLPEGVEYINKDARLFLNQCQKKYDAIVYDLYGAFSITDNAFTVEAFEQAKECLSEEGLLVINTLKVPGYDRPDAILHGTLKEVFDYIDYYKAVIEQARIVNGLWLASNESIGPVRLTGGTEPENVRRELEDYWFYRRPVAAGDVSTDALPLLSLAMEPVMQKERRFTFLVYGPQIMHP